MIISWEALVDDAAQFVEESTHNKDVTFSFLAHSTGGAIALCLHNLLSSRPEYKGLYSIAPLIHPPPIPSFVLCALKTFLLCLPCLCSSSSLFSPPRKTDTEPWLVFSSPEAYRVEAVDDPLQWQGKIPLGTGSVLIDFAKHVTNSVIPELSEKNVRPIKIVHGVEDGLVSVEGSRALTAAVEEAEIWEIKGERHVPLQGNLGERARTISESQTTCGELTSLTHVRERRGGSREGHNYLAQAEQDHTLENTQYSLVYSF